ncbi:MAG: leucyl aminopeptidase [Dehalococcoidia bacterium]
MNITIRRGNVLQEPSDLAMLAAFEGEALPAGAAGLLEPADFSGKAGQTLLLYPRGAVAPKRLLLVGLGKRESLTADGLRQAAATAIKRARELQISAVSLGVAGGVSLEPALAGQVFAEGIELGAYRYLTYRTGLSTEQTFKVEQATVLSESGNEDALRAGVARGQTIAGGVNFARDLVNTPGYAKTPAKLGEEAEALGKRLGLKVMVLDKAQLTEQGFGGILAVGQGSDNDPRFIAMEYGRAGAGPTICLVGKGLTFDSGGLSLKPAEAMETMKSDMGGSAAVFGAMQVAAELKLPIHLVGLISSAENMPSATAYRPGDIIKSLSGQTIEVLNTDAEGRIILSDALFYAQRYNPAAIVELSTLTGAIIIALGSHATGLVATDQALADRISKAGEVTGERVWQLPLWDEYRQMVKSEVADLKNLAGRPAGSITAGAFLAAFTGDFPFAHLDIAGTAWLDRPNKAYELQGGTGVGVRLLTELLEGYRQ